MTGTGFRQALVLTFAIWFLFVYGSYCVSELIAGRTGFIDDLPLDLLAILLIALVAQTLYPLALATAGWPVVRRSAVLAACVLVVAFVQSLINLVENRMLGVIPALDLAYVDLMRTRFASNFLNHVYLSMANAALLVFVVEARRSSEQRLDLARAEAAMAEARTVALRLQLNPHFVFNTLNSISSLIVTRRYDDAEEMIERLAEFLRQSLEADPSGLVPLEEEFATAETYLDIEAVRFGDRMAVDLHCPAPLARIAVPNYILQPLVENAVKYGVARSIRPVMVRVIAEAVEDRLCICVCDDARADPLAATPPGFGIGAENIGQRLAARYGDAASLTTERGPDGYVATVSLPLPPVAAPSRPRAARS
ncbi:histidine kinase [Sphingomonas sp. AP4-R1]|uniref:sensor histidine kinase n=1 Tax=Sphingomonas sp. AP4-R1 TaxID=2735134 RepID=UPI0014936884|nr:histidine kinase [Sphingomonas sp. AP4-R1]QJU58031.1 histidine kinase [Sphingomonas sp. AP4-R1]